MRKIFVVLIAIVLILSTDLVSANEVRKPEVPAEDKFVKERETNWTCGVLTEYTYFIPSRAILWSKGYLNDNKNPLIVGFIRPQSAEYWVDKDQDGSFDEHYNSPESLFEKYPTPCDAVAK